MSVVFGATAVRFVRFCCSSIVLSGLAAGCYPHSYLQTAVAVWKRSTHFVFSQAGENRWLGCSFRFISCHFSSVVWITSSFCLYLSPTTDVAFSLHIFRQAKLTCGSSYIVHLLLSLIHRTQSKTYARLHFNFKLQDLMKWLSVNRSAFRLLFWMYATMVPLPVAILSRILSYTLTMLPLQKVLNTSLYILITNPMLSRPYSAFFCIKHLVCTSDWAVNAVCTSDSSNNAETSNIVSIDGALNNMR